MFGILLLLVVLLLSTWIGRLVRKVWLCIGERLTLGCNNLWEALGLRARLFCSFEHMRSM